MSPTPGSGAGACPTAAGPPGTRSRRGCRGPRSRSQIGREGGLRLAPRPPRCRRHPDRGLGRVLRRRGRLELARGGGAVGRARGLRSDVKAVFAWLRDRPDVADTRIGGWGVSYGGGAAWNSLAAGVPWAALEVSDRT